MYASFGRLAHLLFHLCLSVVMKGDDKEGKGDEDLKELGQVAKLKTELRESKTKIIVLEAQVAKLEAQLSSAKVAACTSLLSYTHVCA